MTVTRQFHYPADNLLSQAQWECYAEGTPNELTDIGWTDPADNPAQGVSVYPTGAIFPPTRGALFLQAIWWTPYYPSQSSRQWAAPVGPGPECVVGTPPNTYRFHPFAVTPDTFYEWSCWTRISGTNTDRNYAYLSLFTFDENLAQTWGSAAQASTNQWGRTVLLINQEMMPPTAVWAIPVLFFNCGRFGSTSSYAYFSEIVLHPGRIDHITPGWAKDEGLLLPRRDFQADGDPHRRNITQLETFLNPD